MHAEAKLFYEKVRTGFEVFATGLEVFAMADCCENLLVVERNSLQVNDVDKILASPTPRQVADGW